MKYLLLSLCICCCAFASADDPDIRSALQAKYDAVDSGMNAGNMRALANFCDSSKFTCTNIQKQRQSLSEFLGPFAHKGQTQLKTVVESADTLNGMAKAALRISITQTATENGKTVAYKCIRTEEDTWTLVGDDWKLVEAHLTSNYMTRNGKVIANESEHVLTDWDRQYGHRPSSRRRHG